jgi:transcriptional regulator with XRE-family HTH domain
MNGMTISQIAELCGVEERTVRRWLKRASDKMSGLSDKMSEAFKTKTPATFTLEETVAIIRAGGNETLADLLAQNAGQGVNPIHTLDDGSAYTARDIEMVLLGYRRGFQEAGKLPPQASASPALKALPHYQERRKPITQMEATARIEMAKYPVTLRTLARMLNVDPNIALRASDRCDIPRSGRQDRALFIEEARKISERIYADRAARKNRKVE